MCVGNWLRIWFEFDIVDQSYSYKFVLTLCLEVEFIFLLKGFEAVYL